jgi:endonuclease YncB( thermonuclease family)
MYHYRVKKINKVFDGDTISLKLDLGFNMSIDKVFRLASINTPELKGKNKKDALKAKEFLENKLDSDSEIIAITYKNKLDENGFYFIDLIIEGININKQMVYEGYALPI